MNSEWPAVYEIHVQGVLDDRWSSWFEGLEVTEEGDETALSGLLPDQPALHAVLDKIRDLGLSITSVRRRGIDGERP